jgi:hypothetical protein
MAPLRPGGNALPVHPAETSPGRLARAFGTAPADRAPWRRGPRALLALVATLAVLAGLLARREPSGSTGNANRSWEYREDGPIWVDPVLLAIIAALVVTALALWAARRPLAVGLAVGLLPLLIAGGVTSTVIKNNAGRVSPAEVKAAARLSDEAQVRAVLGPPAGHGAMTGRTGRADCLLYLGDAVSRGGWRPQHLFCFREGRLIAQESL